MKRMKSTNVRKGKMDCYPHPRLVEILKSL